MCENTRAYTGCFYKVSLEMNFVCLSYFFIPTTGYCRAGDLSLSLSLRKLRTHIGGVRRREAPHKVQVLFIWDESRIIFDTLVFYESLLFLFFVTNNQYTQIFYKNIFLFLNWFLGTLMLKNVHIFLFLNRFLGRITNNIGYTHFLYESLMFNVFYH